VNVGPLKVHVPLKHGPGVHGVTTMKQYQN